MSQDVIVVGGGDHGKVIADIILRRGDRLLGFLDENMEKGSSVLGYPVLGTVAQYRDYPDAAFIIGVGNGTIRRLLAQKLQGVQWYTAIHPNACISPLDTVLGEGTVVCAGAIVSVGAKLGRHCIVNTGGIVDHECRLSDYVHVAVGASLAGCVRVEENTWIGVGAAVRNHVSICDQTMIGAGAVVVKDITQPGTYVGIPARLMK